MSLIDIYELCCIDIILLFGFICNIIFPIKRKKYCLAGVWCKKDKSVGVIIQKSSTKQLPCKKEYREVPVIRTQVSSLVLDTGKFTCPRHM